MKVGSMFAGIGGFDRGFERAGFDVVWCIEWDKNAQAVLRKRFPKATVYGDIREVDPAQLERVDVVCGGFPCQDLSVAGKRAGLAGERSGLFHDAMRIVRRLRPSVLILENVPGLLSSNRGLDFATVLREVGEGWDCQEVAWRVLDSQYFGVAQRRRRVFIVGSARAGCAEQILALAEGSGGNPPSRDKAREDAAEDSARCFAGTRESCIEAPLETTANDYSRADGFNMVVGTIVIDRAAFNQGTNAAYEPRIEESPEMSSLVARGLHAVAHAFYSTGGSHGLEPHPGVSPPLKVGSSLGIPSPPAVAFKTGNSAKSRSDGLAVEQSPTLGSNAGGNTVPAVSMGMVVRRLTPVECERLQGFPDGWTDIGTPEKPTANTHRYKQLGNAVTVNVAQWIARRTAEALA